MYRTTTRKCTRGMFGRMRWLALAVALLPSAMGCVGITGERPAPVSVAEIVSMSQAGVAPDEIIEKIRESGTVYKLSGSQLADLKAKGVSDAVLDYIEQTRLEAVRRRQELLDESHWSLLDDGYWYGGYPFGWDEGWFPEVEVPHERDRDRD